MYQKKSDLIIPDTFFTASTRLHKKDEVLSGEAPFYANINARYQRPNASSFIKNIFEVEDVLESLLPKDVSSRKISRFACKTESDALMFGHSQYDKGTTFYIYEVLIPNAEPAPMAIIGRIRTYGLNVSLRKPLALEYWTPKLRWNYWEFIGPQMTILEDGKSIISSGNKIGSAEYQQDRKQALTIR